MTSVTATKVTRTQTADHQGQNEIIQSVRDFLSDNLLAELSKMIHTLMILEYSP